MVDSSSAAPAVQAKHIQILGGVHTLTSKKGNCTADYILPLLRGAGPMALMLWLNG
jgi:hypothetical protein